MPNGAVREWNIEVLSTHSTDASGEKEHVLRYSGSPELTSLKEAADIGKRDEKETLKIKAESWRRMSLDVPHIELLFGCLY